VSCRRASTRANVAGSFAAGLEQSWTAVVGQGHETIVLIYSDAVAQGLSKALLVRDVGSWVVFTVGSGLGNAPFRNG
jgi:hypothetical protein